MNREPVDRGDLTPAERARLSALRDATSLAELVEVTGADSEHEAYFTAKHAWWDLRGKELALETPRVGLPGDSVTIDGHEFVVHGITHADTPAERETLRAFVADLDPDTTAVYCEQGVRRMYFEDRAEVCEMDDYHWAIDRCEAAAIDSPLELHSEISFAGLREDLDSVAKRLQRVIYTFVDEYGGQYAPAFKSTLGAVLSTFLTSHEDFATGDEFEALAKTERAATDPDELEALQRYYKRRFLPQPLEREWLRRHDRRLEILTHARNERMAEYVVYHNETIPEVHLLVGAAHQPGVTYYLERIRDGLHSVDGFEPVG